MYRTLIRPLLFLVDPETIHHFIFQALKWSGRIPPVRTVFAASFQVNQPQLAKEICGIHFGNPVGLAAGFDKDAKLVNELSSLGFGFIEIGTLTPKPQEGNPKPRLFRLPMDKALINRMGFNNGGVSAAAERLKKRRPGIIVGGNIGKNKLTPNETAVQDYLYGVDALSDVVNYFVVNVSSPNTPGLRELQEKEPLKQLMKQVKARSLSKATPRPVFLKIAPDLTDTQLDDIVEILKETGTDGVIATNTTVQRSGLQTPTTEIEKIGAGGLSGAPLTSRSTEVIRHLREKLGKNYPIIAVGGIMSPADAIEKLEAGADLLQIYTGFIYEGPGFVKRILKAILAPYNR